MSSVGQFPYSITVITTYEDTWYLESLKFNVFGKLIGIHYREAEFLEKFPSTQMCSLIP